MMQEAKAISRKQEAEGRKQGESSGTGRGAREGIGTPCKKQVAGGYGLDSGGGSVVGGRKQGAGARDQGPGQSTERCKEQGAGGRRRVSSGGGGMSG